MSVVVTIYPRYPFSAGRTIERHEHRSGMRVRDVVPEWMIDNPGLVVQIDGEPASLGDGLLNGACVSLAIRPQDAPGNLVDAVGAGFARLFNIRSLTDPSYVLRVGVGIAAQLLRPLARLNQPRSSATYDFDGIQNVRQEGNPRACHYGLMRSGGTIIQEWVEPSDGISSAKYRVLISYGEGPILGVGSAREDTPNEVPLRAAQLDGVFINGNAADTYGGVRAWFRTGTAEQESIPGFGAVRTTVSVDTTLDQEEGDGRAFDEADHNSTATSVQDNWTQYAVTVDLTSDDYEAAEVQIYWPGGLYELDNQGGIDSVARRFLVRYIELDGTGSPITTGGDNGDGYVYPEIGGWPLPGGLVDRQIQDAFTSKRLISFHDPQTWNPTQTGAAVLVNPGYLETNGLGISAGAAKSWTWAGWVGMGGSASAGPIWSWGNNTDGLMLRMDTDAGYQRISARFPASGKIITGGQEWATTDLRESTALVEWTHVAISWSEDSSLTYPYSVRIYVNGRMVHAGNGPDYEASVFGHEARLGLNLGATSTSTYRFDGWVWYDKVVDPAVIEQLYAGGVGTVNPPSANLRDHWTFDNYTTSGPDRLWESEVAFGTDFKTYPTSAGSNTAAGGVYSLGSDLKASHWRVECLRLDQKPTSSRVQDEAIFRDCIGIVYQEFSYPEMALLGVEIEASEQLQHGTPTIISDIWGRLVPVWDQGDTDQPLFLPEWSDNPAWIAADMCLNDTFGAGAHIETTDLDVLSLQELADYDGEQLVDAGTPAEVFGSGWVDINYVATVPIGRIQLEFSSAADIPGTWAVGRYVSFSSFPLPASDPDILLDVNKGGADGVDALRIFRIDGRWVILDWPLSYLNPPFTADAMLSDDLGVTLTGAQVDTNVRRWAFNGVFDEFAGFWDALNLVCNVGHGKPVREGNRIRFHVDKIRSTVGKIGMGSTSIEEGGESTFSATYLNRRNSPNRVEVDILDAEDGFRRRSPAYTDPDVESGANAEAVRSHTVDGKGITNVHQAIRHAMQIVNRGRLLEHRGSYRTGPASIDLQPGDVVAISHELIPRGESGRLLGSSSTTVVQLDREVVLAAATTYYLDIRNTSSHAFESLLVTSTAGTYARGANITVTSGYSFTPAAGDEWVLYVDGEQLLGEIVRRSTGSDLVSDFEWIEYSASVYATDSPSTDLLNTSGGTHGPDLTDFSLPTNPEDLAIAERYVEEPGSESARRSISVSWTHASDTVSIVGSTRVWVRRGSEGAWRVVGTADATAGGLSFDLPGASWGETYWVAVQPISVGGVSRSPEGCVQRAVTLSATAPCPSPPTGLAARLDGQEAVYSWTLPAGRTDLQVELRRGGWILGDLVGVSKPGETELRTTNWSSGPDNAAGDAGATIYARCRAATGELSTAATVVFDPSPVGVSQRANDGLSLIWYYAWEDWGDGWKTDSVPPATDPTLTNLTRNADGHLEFTGASLTASYETAASIVPTSGERADRHHLEAIVAAWQIHPDTIDDRTDWQVDDPQRERWTIEGPLTVHGTEDGNCTLAIEFRYVTEAGGSWTDWQAWRPCVESVVLVQFRLSLTRPTSSYQVRIESFRTRARRIARQRYERTPQQAVLEKEALSG